MKKKIDLYKMIKGLTKDLLDDVAIRALDIANGVDSIYTRKTTDELYSEIIARLEIILRVVSKEKEWLPF